MSATYEGSYQTTIDADTFHPRDDADRAQTADEASAAGGGLPLGLPEPVDLNNVAGLELGESVALEGLGPLVVNADGSLSRIANWSKMTEAEQQNTQRVIAARNKQRLDALNRQPTGD